ncbi:hypothetical protein EV193_104445 [Herbihabitans rhizosphaerae]|uniref:Uncharacterized protein n=1 Tax=Herbihabitans rhizosphaerae TaxID=1872711 RepID=A0A4Q7KQW7_9PSEU|nr:hypothetical protein [Herbihabitans rhizosphaerae]RZS39229.1 hypothetical protein EV193_104445 [Herbihabitans rhizosphaerae]
MGFEADPKGLEGLTNQLAAGPAELARAARTATGLADAGPSTPDVGRTVASIVNAASALVAVIGDTAGSIDASRGSYGTVENNNMAKFRESRQSDGGTGGI